MSQSLPCSCRCFVKQLVFLVAIGVICASVIIWNSATKPKPTPVITTLDGPIQGNIKYSRNGQEYWQFLGIPYGEPPVGEGQYQPPVPVKPWKTVKQVTNQPPLCAQYDTMISSRTKGQMDCLFLNVFVNAGNINESKPVLVYIHGGAFLSGGARMYLPQYFMSYDVVLVVMNYRLGPYGFLNLRDMKANAGRDVPLGNMGLKDQRLVLKWVQRNIAKFGGDPQRVTLFGESAGGVAAHLHVLSPMSRGLFHKAVVQSGTALAPWAFTKKPISSAMEYGKKVGCPVEKANGLLECFETTSWEDLVKYQYMLMEPLEKKSVFGPTIDGKFLTDEPHDIIITGNFPRIPIMFGVNDAEGSIRTGRFDAMPELIPKLDTEWTDAIANLMLLDEPLSADLAMKIREKYFNKMSFMDDVDGFKKNLTQFMSDSGFFDPAHKSAIYHAQNGSPTYLYYFNYTSNIYPGLYTLFRATRLDDWLPAEIKLMWGMSVDWVAEHVFGGRGSRPYGISHGEDGFQLWNIEGMTEWLSGYDLEFSRAFIKALVDFANDTNPLTFREVEWPSVNDHLSSGKDEYSMPYMLMDNADIPRVIPEPFGNRIKFWRNLKDWNY